MIAFSLRNNIDSECSSVFFSPSDKEKHPLTSFKTPLCMTLRNHYYNTKYHPSKIVRAYRKTRNWLTEQFVFAEHRISNIYSASLMLTFFIAFWYVNWFFTFSGGPNAGLDVDQTQKKKE